MTTEAEATYGKDRFNELFLISIEVVVQQPQMLMGVRPNGQEDTSQYRLYIDLEKAQAQGVAITDIKDRFNELFLISIEVVVYSF